MGSAGARLIGDPRAWYTGSKMAKPLWWSRPSAVLRYAAAIVSVALAVTLARVMDHYWKSTPFVSLFLLAIMFSAWFGGFRPGMLAAVLSILAFQSYFVPPIYSIAVNVV